MVFKITPTGLYIVNKGDRIEVMTQSQKVFKAMRLDYAQIGLVGIIICLIWILVSYNI